MKNRYLIQLEHASTSGIIHNEKEALILFKAHLLGLEKLGDTTSNCRLLFQENENANWQTIQSRFPWPEEFTEEFLLHSYHRFTKDESAFIITMLKVAEISNTELFGTTPASVFEKRKLLIERLLKKMQSEHFLTFDADINNITDSIKNDLKL